MSKPKVLLVAGHGGGDPGSIARGRTEAAEAIDIVNKAVKYIETDGRIDVVVVPHDLGMQGGINWINQQAGTVNDDILAVSVHKNSFAGEAYGYETWAGESTFSVQRVKDFHAAVIKKNKLIDRGIKDHLTHNPSGLGFIRETKFEALLTENGFMQTDPFDNDIYGLALAQGVYKYYGLTLQGASTIPSQAKYYRVFDNNGKQLGAFTSQANAWKKFDSENAGKITGLDGSDITQQMIDQYGTVVEDTSPDYDHLEGEIAANKASINKTKADNTAQDTRLDKVETNQNLLIDLAKGIGELFNTIVNKLKKN